MDDDSSWSTYFLSWLSLPFVFLLRMFGLIDGRDEEENVIRVSMKTSEGMIPMTLQKDWTVGQVKARLAGALRVKPSDLGIILAGRQLGDDVELSKCDLGQQTVLHAVQVTLNQTARNKSSSEPMNEDLLDLQLTQEEKQSLKSKACFYVYCAAKSCCKSMQPGKLRVRCFSCKEGAIIVSRDPCNWQDVLGEPGTITGRCLNPSCLVVPKTDRMLAPVQFYFKCHGQGHQDDPDGDIRPYRELEAPPLHLVRSNLHEIPCLACGDTLDPVLVFECPDKHVICIECFGLYTSSRLDERQFVADQELGYTLGCPVGCPDSLISETKHFRAVLSDEDYERYKRFGAEECVLQAGGVLCPQPGCGMGILTQDQRVVCQACQYVFCRNCLHGFHIGDCTPPVVSRRSSVEYDAQSASRSRWIMDREGLSEASSFVAIKITTKPCPKCRTPTERDGGCMHMECTRPGCGFEWCWVCQTPWTRECMANHWFG